MTRHALMNTYGDRAATLIKGEGAWLWDEKGKRYLDALSGIAVCGLGHSHPSVAKAIAKQATILTHCSNFFAIPNQEELAKNLCQVSGMSKVFFGNSGAEANEAAIKMARLFGNKKGLKLPTVLVMDNAFHGRTLATLSASGSRRVQAGFEPLVSGFVRAPFNNIDCLSKIADNNHNICAILVEPIQGEGGIRIASDDYLSKLRQFCDEKDWLLMLDEVQTGNGRTGKYFCYQHGGIIPDVVTTSKGLGNGMPIGACLASGKATDLLQPGNHGSTFGGNPLACAAALATIKTIQVDGLLDRATVVGERIMSGLRSELAGVEHVKDIRGLGCMIGIELNKPCKSLFGMAMAKGLVINVTAESVIRLLPPFIMTDDEADQLVAILAPLIKAFNKD
ncbi:MAG: acetylornithine aminotransferase [SAR92 bacterium BACL26 MAG-121220-bin70]|jgi:acetylornithine/N-succinyldiaminopimelate aminotransferase|uniref:Acetylornithine aminotransferase n=1 Tax=SAR92 bacterium BACL26 MAG-121220-bin70 TaxID=1655626 RepID=A0A0R2U360_9GAMM|nr:MAG: acetylornithine aminotransferase [SAR92 bacterium BACL26 MAG-121220-bin70]